MTVVIVKPGYAPYEAEINGVGEMQEVVGGNDPRPSTPYEDRAAVVCNDAGHSFGCRTTEAFHGGYGGVFGPFLAVRLR